MTGPWRLLTRYRERRAARRYDRLLRVPLSPEATAALRARIESGDPPRRRIRRELP